MHATHDLSLQGCRGRWGMSIETRSSYGEQGDAFLAAPASGYPPIVMYVGFEVDDRGSAACSQLLDGMLRCDDYYVVELDRLARAKTGPSTPEPGGALASATRIDVTASTP